MNEMKKTLIVDSERLQMILIHAFIWGRNSSQLFQFLQKKEIMKKLCIWKTKKEDSKYWNIIISLHLTYPSTWNHRCITPFCFFFHDFFVMRKLKVFVKKTKMSDDFFFPIPWCLYKALDNNCNRFGYASLAHLWQTNKQIDYIHEDYCKLF